MLGACITVVDLYGVDMNSNAFTKTIGFLFIFFVVYWLLSAFVCALPLLVGFGKDLNLTEKLTYILCCGPGVFTLLGGWSALGGGGAAVSAISSKKSKEDEEERKRRLRDELSSHRISLPNNVSGVTNNFE